MAQLVLLEAKEILVLRALRALRVLKGKKDQGA
jgi:hypothetical protein